MSQGNFTASQKGNRKLEYKGFLYNKSITISKGIQQGNIKWRCENIHLIAVGEEHRRTVHRGRGAGPT